LYVDYTGVAVSRGDHLVKLYSPDLVVTQRELLQAMGSNARATGSAKELTTETLRSVEEKLRLLGLLPEQIEEIKELGVPTAQITVHSPTTGVVIHKNANEGMYVDKGTRIYTIANLDQVWVHLDAFESDLPWLLYGEEVEFTSESYPGDIFIGKIVFISDVLDEQTRTVRVRLNVPNKDRKLKPGMFVRALAKSTVARGGRVMDDSLAGKWTSPMHPEIIKDQPGKCDICGMDLVPVETFFFNKQSDSLAPLVIPYSAALVIGKRAIVYVSVGTKKEPKFTGREISLGPRAGDYYIVRHGLTEGEQVVVSGNFRIDADLQLKGKQSMMFQVPTRVAPVRMPEVSKPFAGG
jgi:Cu(I)/Ag(I) efflux system membrane fusion protein